MRRRVLLCFVLALASGCRGGDAVRPIADPSAPPSRSISDATHASGNPDFFFLPPMVKNPSASPNWNPGAFNGALKPSVDICELPGTLNDQNLPTASTPCGASVFSGFAAVNLADESYQLNWQVPSSSTTFYRITVSIGAIVLGWADVETASSMSQLKNVNTGEYVPLNDGRKLPIKFRIEQYALCTEPGTGPCTSAAVDLSAGGTVQAVLDPVNAPLPAGITIPAGAGTTTVNITVDGCPDFNPRVTDLPTFGGCVRITAQPSLPESGFATAVTVFNCNVNDETVPHDDPATGLVGRVRNHEQADRITLHQLDMVGDQAQLVALPHTTACGGRSPTGSIHGLLEDLRHGKLKSATKQMLAMLTPKSAYAAMFIDLGGGGFISEGGGLSDFQFALPAKFTIDAKTDNVIVGPDDTATAKVIVSDLDGQPVSGATVNFAPGDGSVSPTSVRTGIDGRASTVWTVRPSGTSTLTVSGRGIAGNDNSGPREGVDPFQPIQTLYYTSPLDLSVPVLTGSVLFHASAEVVIGSSDGQGRSVSDPNPGSLYGTPLPKTRGAPAPRGSDALAFGA